MTPYSYESCVWRDSVVAPGVRYLVERMSFGRRIELMKAIHVLGAKSEFDQRSGEGDKMKSAIVTAEIERTYLLWGLREVEGLVIDGESATRDRLATSGPEEIFREALSMVKSETGLSDEEKKTSS